MRQRRITRTAALAVALGLSAAPAAFAQGQDLRSADAIDAATPPQQEPAQDLRHPDSVDASAGRGTASAPQVTVVRMPASEPASGGLDWADAGIGAGGMLGIVLLGLGGTAIVTHRRPHRRATVA